MSNSPGNVHVACIAMILFLSPPTPVNAQPSPESDRDTTIFRVGRKKLKLVGANAKRLTRVRRKGVSVFYPLVFPSRFSLKSVNFSERGESRSNMHADYALVFFDKRGRSFTVESAYDGIGDGPDGYKSLKGICPSLGTFTIDVFRPNSEGNATNRKYYISSWMPDAARRQSTKANEKSPAGRYHHFYGDGVSDAEAIAIVKSLTEIK